MKKICKQTGKEFEISQWEVDFIKRVSPTFGGIKFDFPLPDLCPEERTLGRTFFRNEQNLFKNKSSLSGEGVISIYADNDYQIYTHDQWWDTNFDALKYGRDYDFGRGFFEQFKELDLTVPRVNLVQVANENCPYTTGTGYCRNCHLINCSENCEDCIYAKLLQGCRDCIDCAYGYDCELCYQCFYVTACYNCNYLSYSQNCSDCLFSENLKGCRNCFLCTNLSNKEYHFMNKPVSKEQYEKLRSDCLGSHRQTARAKEILDKMRTERIYKYANAINCENSTGDFLTNCKNCFDCFDVNDSEDCRYVQVGVQTKDILDCSNMYIKPELSYQVLGTIGTYNVHFSLYVFGSQNVFYSQFCHDCSDLFGCVGLRNKHYCIFNKQYSQEEYEQLVLRIVKAMQERCVAADGPQEWGIFFPSNLSPFAYNDTVAHQYLPLSKEEALGRGFRWREAEEREVAHMDFAIADNISEVDESICAKILVCEKTGKNYKILPKEFQFLKRMKMPVPRICPDERHKMRMAMRNPMRLFDRKCAKCGRGVQSSFEPEDKRTIYCEECYLKAVF